VTLTEVGRHNGDPVRGRWKGLLALIPINMRPQPK
jgi:hypothetical protein